MTENTQGACITGRLNKPLNQSSRNYGIDLLRIFAMLMIITLHVLGQGGILFNTKAFTLQYEVSWSIRLFCFIGVNIYALISGYVGLYSKYKPYKIITMWLQVELYNIAATAIAAKLGIIELSGTELIKAVFPVMNNNYWYFTAYVGLFIFIPLLNRVVLTLEKKSMDRFLLFSVITFAVFELIHTDNALGFKKGYSMIFLILLYLTGAYLKKYNIAANFSKMQLIIILVFSFLITFAGKNLLEYTYEKAKIDLFHNMFFGSYNNILFIISAIALVLLFSKLDIKNRFCINSIKTLAPLTFGIYIIHLTPVCWHYLKNATKFLLDEPIYSMIIGIVLFTVCIFIACAAIEYIRALLFRIFKIDKFSKWIYGIMAKVWHFLKKAVCSLYRITNSDTK